MGLLMMLILAQAVTEEATSRPVYTVAQITAATPETLADALLPAGHAPAVRVQIIPDAGDPATRPLDSVLLYARPSPGPRGFCRADVVRVAFTPFEYATDARAGGRPFRAHGTTRSSIFRLAEGEQCLADTRGYFAVTGTPASGLAAVRALVAVKRAADAGARLPIVTCADPTGRGACRDGTRAVLAAIRTDAIGSVAVGACSTMCQADILIGTADPRPAYWTMAMTMRAEIAARITLVYTVSPTH